MNFNAMDATSYVIPNRTLTEQKIREIMNEFKIASAPTLSGVTAQEASNEEWIWVTGYKGTNADLTCRDHQFEIGKLYNMPEDTAIRDCHSGFHLCKELKDVFGYYKVGDGHRFFEVQALVRKKDADEYGVERKTKSGVWIIDFDGPRDKLASKSIILTRELTIDEILKDTEASEWAPEYKKMAMEHDLRYARRTIQAKTLVGLGYSEAFAKYIAESDKYEIAFKVGSQKDLSMDMKVLVILRGL